MSTLNCLILFYNFTSSGRGPKNLRDLLLYTFDFRNIKSASHAKVMI